MYNGVFKKLVSKLYVIAILFHLVHKHFDTITTEIDACSYVSHLSQGSLVNYYILIYVGFHNSPISFYNRITHKFYKQVLKTARIILARS